MSLSDLCQYMAFSYTHTYIKLYVHFSVGFCTDIFPSDFIPPESYLCLISLSLYNCPPSTVKVSPFLSWKYLSPIIPISGVLSSLFAPMASYSPRLFPSLLNTPIFPISPLMPPVFNYPRLLVFSSFFFFASMVPFHFPKSFGYIRIYTHIKDLELRSTNEREHMSLILLRLCYFT